MTEVAPESTKRVRLTYDRLAPAYNRRWARYIAATTRETLARLSLRPCDRLLDLGCGTGALLRELGKRLPPAQLTGVDLSAAMVGVARASLPTAVQLAVADAAALPFQRGTFDVVVSNSSFHFWSQPDRALGELRRILRAGGRLVITDWCGDYLACRLFDSVLGLFDPAHRRVYRTAECGGFLRASGLVDVSVERYRATWVWGMMTANARTSGHRSEGP
jgi:ubiquinone/menaquinone biosynthesis C-methylase UbiE